MRRRRNNEDDDNGFAEWGGYMEYKKSKLLEQFHEETNKHPEQKQSKIFEGIAIFVNGYTDPTAEELKRIMSVHGGTYHHYESSSTTHIIATILPNVKIKQLGPNHKVLKPSWISESLKAGKLLDYKNYLLYTNESKTQPKLATVVQNMENSRSTKTAVDPSFLSEFYNNSRLHLISSLGASFKKKITDLREVSDFKFPAREGFKQFVALNPEIGGQELGRVIMHIDMDCFFVSVGLLTRPHLKGTPVAVTHASANQVGPERPERQIELKMYRERLQKRVTVHSDFVHQDLDEMAEIESRVDGIDSNNSMSEIASCSYEARLLGVKNGMFLGTAMKLCPNLQTIPYEFNEYTRISNLFYDTVAQYTLDVEPVSCDEMMVDCTELLNDCGATVNQWATYIRNEIKNVTNCTCSTGFGANRLQARLASRTAKPNGQFHLLPQDVELHMWDIPVSNLPGVGRSLEHRLKGLNLKTCGDLQKMELSKLQSIFGERIGKGLFQNCRGQDDRVLVFDHVRKSVSAEVNYGIRFANLEEAENFIKQLCGEVHSRLMEVNMKGKCITLKLMVRAKDAPVQSSKFMGHGLCENVTKSTTLSVATNELEIVQREILSIWKKVHLPPSDLRGIGIQISRLEKPQISKKIKETSSSLKTLFEKQSKQPSKTTVNEEVGLKQKSQEKVQLLFEQQVKALSQNSNPVELTEESIPICNKTLVKLKSSPTKRSTSKSQKRITTIFHKKKPSIDPEFLKELPEDIRKELMEQHNIKDSQLISQSIDSDVIDETVLNELPEDIRNEIIQDYNRSKQANLNSATITSAPGSSTVKEIKPPDKWTSQDIKTELLQTLSWKELKDLVKQWIKEHKYPEKFDIDVIANFAYEMAITRKIDILYDFIKNFHMLAFNESNCEWHNAYFVVINRMQEGMLLTYKSKLATVKYLPCDKCRVK